MILVRYFNAKLKNGAQLLISPREAHQQSTCQLGGTDRVAAGCAGENSLRLMDSTMSIGSAQL